MWLTHYVPGMERKCSHSQKSNDRILPGFLIVLTRQENYSFQAKSGSVFGIVWLPIRIFSPLKNINTLEKYQRDCSQVFWSDSESAVSRFWPNYLPAETSSAVAGKDGRERRCYGAPCWSTWRKSGQLITRTQVSIAQVARSISVGRKASRLKPSVCSKP